jgi:hypothetical protein
LIFLKKLISCSWDFDFSFSKITFNFSIEQLVARMNPRNNEFGIELDEKQGLLTTIAFDRTVSEEIILKLIFKTTNCNYFFDLVCVNNIVMIANG